MALPGSEGVDAVTETKKTVEGTKQREVRVRALTKAKAEVVSILLSVIYQGTKDTSDVTEKLRQETLVRAAWQRQAEKQRHAQRQTQVTTVTERVEVSCSWGCKCVDLRSRANFRL